MNPLIDRLRQYGDLSPEAEQEVNKRTRCFQKRKDDFLLRQGQVMSTLFMLDKGLVRAYFIRKDKEVNTWFGLENMITGSILPLYTEKPSFENIQFLEDSTIYSISVTDLNELYKIFPELNLIGRKMAEELCVILEERITSLHTESAEERYHSLITSFPGLLQRVNLGHIASYLGITQETLSRIRKR
ncbi:Crp/Fnr family transcriptional regulator [Pedobacter sp. UYP1]|jgi:CRP-like cAMP-binding protein|uniref:Crp/Fnr family transcriptional regulator n=1 Tax=Pedobacter sp. UYP1 TaxID=1756396 RepID=UPI003395620F